MDLLAGHQLKEALLVGYIQLLKTGKGGKYEVSLVEAGLSSLANQATNYLVGGNDPEAQTHFVIDKIEGAIESLGGKLEDVVRTRIFVNHIDDWEPIARAHGKRFKGINPANTLVEAKLVGEGYLVEIEAEARIK